MVDRGVGRETGPAAPVQQGSEWIEEFGWAHRAPDLSKYRGVVTVFRLATQPYWRIRDPGLGWEKQAETVRIERLPGDDRHAILRNPQVGVLAQRVQDCLREAGSIELDRGEGSPAGERGSRLMI